jgi:hypothetical protein
VNLDAGVRDFRVRAENVARSREFVADAQYPKGISSFSPVLADNVGLRWVTTQKDHNPERVEPWR